MASKEIFSQSLTFPHLSTSHITTGHIPKPYRLRADASPTTTLEVQMKTVEVHDSPTLQFFANKKWISQFKPPISIHNCPQTQLWDKPRELLSKVANQCLLHLSAVHCSPFNLQTLGHRSRMTNMPALRESGTCEHKWIS